MLNRFSKATNPSILKAMAEPDTNIPSSYPPRYNPRPGNIFNKAQRTIINRYSLILLFLSIFAFSIAYQVRPTIFVNLGGGYDLPYLDNFAGEVRPNKITNQTEDTTDTPRGEIPVTTNDPGIVFSAAGKPLPEPIKDDYRWTKPRSIVLLPGVGAYPGNLTLYAAASPLYPHGQKVAVLLNGQDFTTFEVKPGVPQRFEYKYEATRFQGGNMAVELRVTPIGTTDPNIYSDSKSYYRDGMKLYGLWLEPEGGNIALPDPKTTVLLTVASMFFFWLLAYSGVKHSIAFGISTVFVLTLAIVLAIWRLELAIFTTRLTLVLVATGLALLVFDLLLPRLFQRWNLPLPGYVWTTLLIIFVAGMVLRGGGTLYPQTLIIDQRWHLNVINRILDEPGGIAYEYSNKSDSLVPGQWNSSAIIPYSPFTHFYLAPFAALPIEREVTVNLISIFLDSSRVFIIYALGVALGATINGALAGAALYLILPSTYLLNSWGNWPTTISLWLAVLYLTVALVNYERLKRPRIWIGLTLLLIITNLAYSVTMIFMGMVLYGWATGLFFFSGRKDKQARENGKLLFLSATVAAIGAVAIYYWQFIGDIIPTLNSFGQDFNQGKGLGLGERSFFEYLSVYLGNLSTTYGVIAVLVLGLIGAISLSKMGKGMTSKAARYWFVWVMVANYLLWSIAQWKIDMVDKQVWFIAPLALALSGQVIVSIWSNLETIVRIGNQTVWKLVGKITVSALIIWMSYSAFSLWIYRIFFARH
ncbi:MAG: hypothetical protein HXX08_13050 [Chloroflexi bacterium]|uniref:Uncharacterized protein n=1 Tax=Candidatus Chlorohelix allophototropha TaxID=3003348 RepID=A0A8T7M3Y3_9CHLR|nr:hypothetical protein [Chloroflexota bacterium]WJW70217.1 hypothetical protein OZ401_004735 [Chloroflexota bacterium L227-S17]